MPFSPATVNIPWFEEFNVEVSAISTSSTSTTVAEGSSVVETTVEPVPASLTILSVEPVKTFPPDPTVKISILSSTTFSISGIYKNVMETVHTWRDNDYVLQTSIIPPDPGTYDKIIQIVSPTIQDKPVDYKIVTTNDNVVTVTTTSNSTSIIQDITTSNGIVSATSIVQTGVSLISVIPLSPSGDGTTFTIISTDTNWVSTSTVSINQLQKEILERKYTTRDTLSINTGTETKGAVASGTYTIVVQHTSYNTVRDKILTPLIEGQPEPTE